MFLLNLPLLHPKPSRTDKVAVVSSITIGTVLLILTLWKFIQSRRNLNGASMGWESFCSIFFMGSVSYSSAPITYMIKLLSLSHD